MSVLVGNSLCQFSMGIVDGCVLFSLIYIVFIGVSPNRAECGKLEYNFRP
jgi:hypothetical protein